MTGSRPRILPCGDMAIAVEFGDTIDEEANRQVVELARMVEGENLPGVVEAVPTYRSLLVHLDPLKAEHAKLPEALSRLAGAAPARKHGAAAAGGFRSSMAANSAWRSFELVTATAEGQFPLLDSVPEFSPSMIPGRRTGPVFPANSSGRA